MPFKLKEQLILTFKDGVPDASVRTSISTWIDVLILYQRELGKGWHDIQIKPAIPKTKDYRGIQFISQPVSA